MTMSHPPVSKLFFAMMLVVLFLSAVPAFADVSTLSGAQSQIAGQIVYIPRLVAVFGYVIGTFFAATGLLKMKDWITDPEKNPVTAVIIRLTVAALLIVLPKVLYMTNSTLFGFQSNGNSQDVNTNVPVHSLSAFQ